MSREADIAQVTLPFTFDGQSMPVPICKLIHEIHFTTWLENQAWQTVAKRRPLPDQKQSLGGWTAWDYEMHARAWRNDVDAGEYEFPGMVSYRRRCSESGQKELLFIMMSELTPALTRGTLDVIFADPVTKEQLQALYWRSLAQGRPTAPEPTPVPG